MNTVNFEDYTGIKMWKFTFYFGGIKKFYQSIGVDYEKETIKYNEISKNELVKDVLRVYNIYGHIDQDFYISNGHYSKAPIKRLFGSWNNMMKELNLDINMFKHIEKIPKEAILEDMRKLYEKHGRLTAKIQRKESKYSQNIIDYHFGSFNNMLRELNLPINQAEYDDRILIDDLKRLYNTYGFVSNELINKYSITSNVTYSNRFGSVSKAVELAGIDYNTIRNSSGSSEIEYYLKVYKIKYTKEKTFDWLINPKTSHHLYLDFYLEDYNIGIEYDGRQHFEAVEYFGGEERLKDLQYRDELKNNLCKQNFVTLYRIPYSIKDIKAQIDKIINN